MVQYPYDNRRVESGGANAFKVFIILAFILFIIAIATPVSGNGTSLNNEGAARECGNTTVGNANETVASIAYRCNTTTTTILARNPNLMDANSPVAGQLIVLNDNPPGTVAQAEGQAVSNTVVQPEIVQVPQQVPVTSYVVAPARAPFAYTVQPGDTLARLALAYGTSVDAILAANPGVITNPHQIYAGWQIWIP